MASSPRRIARVSSSTPGILPRILARSVSRILRRSSLAGAFRSDRSATVFFRAKNPEFGQICLTNSSTCRCLQSGQKIGARFFSTLLAPSKAANEAIVWRDGGRINRVAKPGRGSCWNSTRRSVAHRVEKSWFVRHCSPYNLETNIVAPDGPIV